MPAGADILGLDISGPSLQMLRRAAATGDTLAAFLTALQPTAKRAADDEQLYRDIA